MQNQENQFAACSNNSIVWLIIRVPLWMSSENDLAMIRLNSFFFAAISNNLNDNFFIKNKIFAIRFGTHATKNN